MKNFTFENKGTTTYLVYQIGPDEQVDSMTLGMLTNNDIPGLSRTLFTQIDDKRFLKYNVSSKVSVSQFFSGAVNKKHLIGVFRGIVSALLSSEDYMIDSQSIILDLDYIFVDVSTYETSLICLPFETEEAEVNLNTFFKAIMFSTQFDQTENCDHVAKIINYLNSTKSFSLIDFQAILKQLSSEETKREPVKKPAVSHQATYQPKHQAPVVRQGNTYEKKPEPEIKSNNQPTIQKPVAERPIVPPPAKTPQRNMEVPQKSDKADKKNSDEKKMSMWYLLRHYSKENAEIYKSQKEDAQTGGKTKEPTAPPTKEEKPKKKPTAQASFAVPGTQQQNAQIEVPAVPNALPQPKTQPKEYAFDPAPIQQSYTAGGRANFGNTTVLNAGMNRGETTVLNAGSPAELKPYLIRRKNNEKILINKPVYRIGKERSYVDYFIGDNSAISRSHANIIVRDGEYLIMDTNSTNHTYINGEMIPSSVEVKLVNGANIRLANEDFEFRLM